MRDTPPKRRFLPSIHALRGMAAILVVCHHGFRHLHNEFESTGVSRLFFGGASGVQFFFALSGFIIYFIHHGDSKDPGAAGVFFRKRIARVYPVYWVVMLPVAALIFLNASFIPEMPRTLSHFFSNLLLLPSESPLFVAVAWTLSHEMLFYSVFALAFYFLRTLFPLLLTWAGIVIIHGAVVRISPELVGSVLPESEWLSFFLNVNNVIFVMGVLTAKWFVTARGHASLKLARNCFWLGVAGIIALLLLRAWDGPSGAMYGSIEEFPFWFERLAYGVFSCLVLYGEIYAGTLRVFGFKIFKILGDASYSIYLCHALTQTLLTKLIHKLGLFSLPVDVIFLVFVLIPTSLGIVLHYLAEKPLLSFFGKRITPRKQH